jgi:hypothetical protein
MVEDGTAYILIAGEKRTGIGEVPCLLQLYFDYVGDLDVRFES